MAIFTFNDYNSLINDTNTTFDKSLMCPIEEIMMTPKESTLNSILGYSRALSVRESKHLSKIEMILN